VVALLASLSAAFSDLRKIINKSCNKQQQFDGRFCDYGRRRFSACWQDLLIIFRKSEKAADKLANSATRLKFYRLHASSNCTGFYIVITDAITLWQWRAVCYRGSLKRSTWKHYEFFMLLIKNIPPQVHSFIDIFFKHLFRAKQTGVYFPSKLYTDRTSG